LLHRIISHLEGFPNVIGYQVEWGHYGESWINAAFWNSRSANESFRSFLSRVAPSLLAEDFSWWWGVNSQVNGDIVYYSPYLPATDPRRNPAKVAAFYWYQEWRNQVTLNITWSFRCLAKKLTSKPIIGFSYVGVAEVPYVYTADRCLDAAFSPFTPSPNFKPNKFYVRDGYFQGLQLAELDFDTPYVRMEYAEEAVRDAYRKGIVPVIFYPLWSTNLNDQDVQKVVGYMRKYSHEYGKSRGEVLVVVGNYDVGYYDYSGTPPIAVANWNSVEPPGFLRLLEENGIAYEMMDARVYTPELGNKYRVVVVFTPKDTVDGKLIDRLSRTKSTVFIMFPSFTVGTPSGDRPYNLSSAIYGMWNYVKIGNRIIGIQVTGSPPAYQIDFSGRLSKLGSITGYEPNHIFSYFRGSFDETLAEVRMNKESFVVIGRIENLYLIGLDINIINEKNRSIIFGALLALLRETGVQAS